LVSSAIIEYKKKNFGNDFLILKKSSEQIFFNRAFNNKLWTCSNGSFFSSESLKNYLSSIIDRNTLDAKICFEPLSKKIPVINYSISTSDLIDFMYIECLRDSIFDFYLNIECSPKFHQPNVIIQGIAFDFGNSCLYGCNYCYYKSYNFKNINFDIFYIINKLLNFKNKYISKDKVTFIFRGGGLKNKIHALNKIKNLIHDSNHNNKYMLYIASVDPRDLTFEVIDFLTKIQRGVCISLDGPPFINRFWDTQTESNVINCNNALVNCASGVYAANDCSNLIEKYTFYKNLGFKYFQLRPVQTNDANLKLDKKSINNIIKEYEHIVNKLMKNSIDYRRIFLSSITIGDYFGRYFHLCVGSPIKGLVKKKNTSPLTKIGHF